MTAARAREDGGSTSKSPTDAFFSELAARRNDPLLKSAAGTVRFDLLDGDRVQHWYVTMRAGDVTVSRKNAKADAVVRIDRATFDGMASGSVNAIAATLRGDLIAEGDLSLVMILQRLFRSPPMGGAPAPAARAAPTGGGRRE